ncbi:hypothetical protein PEC302110_31320 [Pectobacterium araliae]|uniref:Uncharacterized protein n=1 Tax=Pectobacterium araliae TaxID=3073862 RepID=A0AAN0KDY6_9GAMM|nr:hypothetical protein PEC302110_31320 [Pectobacterium sp. MAFF 302110]
MATFLDPDKIGKIFFIAPIATAGKHVICGADGRNVDNCVVLADVSTTQSDPSLTQQGGASHD